LLLHGRGARRPGFSSLSSSRTRVLFMVSGNPGSANSANPILGCGNSSRVARRARPSARAAVPAYSGVGLQRMRRGNVFVSTRRRSKVCDGRVRPGSRRFPVFGSSAGSPPCESVPSSRRAALSHQTAEADTQRHSFLPEEEGKGEPFLVDRRCGPIRPPTILGSCAVLISRSRRTKNGSIEAPEVRFHEHFLIWL